MLVTYSFSSSTKDCFELISCRSWATCFWCSSPCISICFSNASLDRPSVSAKLSAVFSLATSSLRESACSSSSSSGRLSFRVYHIFLCEPKRCIFHSNKSFCHVHLCRILGDEKFSPGSHGYLSVCLSSFCVLVNIKQNELCLFYTMSWFVLGWNNKYGIS